MSTELWDPLLTMGIAACLHPKPDKQVRRLAKKYLKKCKSKDALLTLDAIAHAGKPAHIVLRTYEVLTKDAPV